MVTVQCFRLGGSVAHPLIGRYTNEGNMSIEHKLEYFKSIQLGLDTTIKWAFTLNGAAAAGLMTFLGGAIDKQDKFSDWSLFGTAMTLFVSGMVVAVICYALRVLSLQFASQLQLHESREFVMEPGDYLQMSNRWIYSLIASLLGFVSSLILFTCGVLHAKWAIFV